MKCKQCGRNFLEKEIQESHNVPCYLFDGNRKGRKNQADKYGRTWLCENCHKEYEKKLMFFLRKQAMLFAKEYLK